MKLSKLRKKLDGRGKEAVFLNTVLPVILACLINGLVFAFGLGNEDKAFTELELAPPSWVVGVVWVALFASYGYARWVALNAGAEGAEAAKWIVRQIIVCALYPLYSWGFDTEVSAYANAFSLLFAIFVIFRVSQASFHSVWILFPSILWMLFANYLGFSALANKYNYL